MDAKTVRITGYIAPEKRLRLRHLAASRGVRVTVLIREAVDDYLVKTGKEN
jgi:hypothetical protein